MPLEEADEYPHGHFQDVQGWRIPELSKGIQPLHEVMDQQGELGPACEVEIHQGNFFIELEAALAQVGT